MKKIEMIGKIFGRIFLMGLLITAAAVMATGCGTTVNMRPTDGSSLEESPKLSFTSIAIEVKTEVEDSQEEAQMLKDFLTKEFKARNITVVESGIDARMTVVIKHLKRYIPGVVRFLVWPFASFNNAELKTEVVITTAKNNLSFLVDISAGSVTGFTGTTEGVLEQAAQKIAEKIL